MQCEFSEAELTVVMYGLEASLQRHRWTIKLAKNKGDDSMLESSRFLHAHTWLLYLRVLEYIGIEVDPADVDDNKEANF